MNKEAVQKILERANNRHRELSILLDYAPFVFDDELKDDLRKYVQETLDNMSFNANEFFYDEQNKEHIANVQKLEAELKKGDAVFSKKLKDAIDEATIYLVKYKTPINALRPAAIKYNKSTDSIWF